MTRDLMAALIAAIAVFLLASAARGGDPEALRTEMREAIAQYNMGYFKDALTRFESIYRRSGDARALFNIAQCHRKLGEPREAALNFRSFLRLNPDSPNAPMARELLAQADAALQKEQQTRTTPAERATPKVSPPGAASKPTGSSPSRPETPASAGGRLQGHASLAGIGPAATHKVVVSNDGTTPWTQCDIRLPTNKHFVLDELEAGDSESIMLLRFKQDGSEFDKPVDSITVKCEQGEARFTFGK
jgi:tetratricopeptide (TPR) repeat protein